MEIRGSKKKFIVLTGLFALVSLVILLYPREITVKGAGKTVSAANYSVPAAVSGKVLEVSADRGSEVQAGSVIMKLGNDRLNREIEELLKAKEINKAIIDSLVEKDRLQHGELRKYKNKLVSGVTTSPAVEAEQKKLQIILKDTAIACKEKERIETKLKYLHSFKKNEDIKAPIDGVILTSLTGYIGRYIPEGEEAFKISGRELVVECFIPERQVRSVSVGSPVTLRPIVKGGKVYHGIIISKDAISETAGIKGKAVRVKIGVVDAIMLVRDTEYRVQIHTGQRTSLVKNIVRHLSF